MDTNKSSKIRYKLRLLRLRAFVREWLLVGIIMAILVVGLFQLGRWAIYYGKYAYHAFIMDDLYDTYNDSYRLNDNYRFYENGAHGYIRDDKSGKKVLKDVAWIVDSDDNDSLMCFASKGYRGFFNKNNGKVEIPADRYKKAWVFSEGLAAVMDEDSTIRFINTSGDVVIDRGLKFASLCEGHPLVFHGGYCAMADPARGWGLIDHQGRWCVEAQYEDIRNTDKGFWIVWKDGRKGLMNDSLRFVLEPVFIDVLVNNYGLEVLREDYTRQLFAFNGTIIHDFTYTRLDDLVYKTGSEDEDQYECTWELSPYKAYYTTYGTDMVNRAGLLGPDGRPVTPPLYHEIKAVNAQCFRCFYGYDYDGEGLSVLINSKGQVIKSYDVSGTQ